MLPDQEENIFVGDILSDGILVIELDCSPPGTLQKHVGLLSPEEEFVYVLPQECEVCLRDQIQSCGFLYVYFCQIRACVTEFILLL